MVDPPDDAKEKAAECLKDAALQSIKNMQKEAVNENSTLAQQSQSDFSELSPEEQAAAAQENKEAIQNRNAQLEGEYVEYEEFMTRLENGEPIPEVDQARFDDLSNRRKDICREYQANHLLLDMDSEGDFPSYSGSGGKAPSDTDANTTMP